MHSLCPIEHTVHISHLPLKHQVLATTGGKACDKDLQCGGDMCCAVSLWIRSLRMCTPMGDLGEECHPLSNKVPFLGRRMHHTCPCLPNLACLRISPSRFKCLPEFRNEDVFF
ncbi:prokineticin-2 isoform X1 [Mauremys reevesii]|uniref:prokineticin-2 isoform X1 n=1 Tax=Mauremys reevesii TaxID=260615 RepID=UPI00193F2657|nr:prokineticin-2 isoform X1 [Mauremys reevesii]XP_039338503.1 prokineticin-2 isoform X1 [Mauremys reevesii]XP_039338504.1 prokineticin-2 isoform X1 [Mauremys reevesii]XP_039338505.1 prokineticin-2 isoform X1 [Mauremys reevesii]XP_039338506.1 prokineticin-2 isoform X1 [Mauremys reevesii]XP_039338507.1 prokineticin-2 isoform X1 [Mauremys reevesii]XP_039338509.1 prokineticin-2 isoform X1 [Mauremys reevesii]XP_039338510.1 prokineticin-2 isoform X1 [Mauremys reevesii]XP_039338511.1 prokineticin